MQNLTTYLLYTFTLIFSCILASKAERKNLSRYLWAIVFIWTFVAGVRGISVGKDTQQYYNIFELIANNNSRITWYGIEASFVTIIRVLLFFWNNTTLPFVFMAALTYGLIIFRFWDFRFSANLPWMIFCFFSMHYFASLNISRQFCAVAIVFFGTRYLSKRKYFLYLVAIAIGVLFHKSAVLGMLFFVFEIPYWKQLLNKQKFFIMVGVLTLPVIGGYIWANLSSYTKYLQVSEVDIGIVLPIKLIIFILLQIGLASNVQKYYLKEENDTETNINDRVVQAKKVRTYYLVGLLMTFLGYFYLFAERGALVFYLYEAVFYGMTIKTRVYDRQMCKLIVLGIFTLIFVLGMTGDGHSVVPYSFIWQN